MLAAAEPAFVRPPCGSTKSTGDRLVPDDPLTEIGAQLAHVTLILQELRARSLTTREASELLDHADIQKLTGSAAVNSQMRWLRDRRIPFRAEFIGAATARKRLILTRFHVRQWIEGTEGKDTPKNLGLNWDAVR